MKTPAQVRQWADYRAKGQTPEVRAQLSESLKRRHRETPEVMLRGITAMHSPEARRKAADGLRRPLQVRFDRHVSIEPNSGCWLWTGSALRLGYGQMRVDGKCVLATHVSLLLAGRPRPSPGACARHKCDNPYCVNPDHLEWGTLKDNSRDSIERGRADFSGLAAGHAAMRALRAQRPTLTCDHCGNQFTRPQGQLKGRKNLFCSSACSIAWQKAAYTGRPIASWSGK